MFLLVIAASLLCIHSSQAVDSDGLLSVIEVIRKWGYPAEVHKVATADGYILDLFRIPHGRFSSGNASCHRPAILMVHGVGIGATEFVLSTPESTPAFLLADAGFDVFLLNHRGSMYSRGHKTLTTKDNKYWQFGIDELAKYDAPAVIDKVLEISGEKSVYWLGHSQGTAVGYMTLAENPEYNAKVKALFQLTPTGTGGYAKGLHSIALVLYETLKPLFDFYRREFGAHEYSMSLGALCHSSFPFAPQICNFTRRALLGPSIKTRAPPNRLRAAITTSTWNVLHWAQMASRRVVEHMDHSSEENLRRYGQATPPAYNYSLIDVPVYHFWSRNDWVSTPEDIEHTLLRMLRKEVVKGSFEIPGYNHGDFAVASDCGELVFKPIVKIVRSQEKNMCEQ